MQSKAAALPPRSQEAADPQPTSDAPASDVPPERRVARRRPAGPSRERIAANDDVPSIGGLIYALNQKPTNKPFLVAAAASGVWAALGLAFVWIYVGSEMFSGRGIATLITSAGFMSGLATFFGPIALFWFLAFLSWRIEELKLRSTAMTEVAVRLAEPDRMAEQSIASLGQAVRRQVSFMNDAVERALGRAGELESLVHNEVSALERSYEENERKIRDLIDDLAGERKDLVKTSDQVTQTLKTLGTEVPTLIETLHTQQVKLAGIIESAGTNLSALEGAIARETGQLENALGGRVAHLENVLQSYTHALDSAFSSRTEQVQAMFEGNMENLVSAIGERTDTLHTFLADYGRALDTTLANRAQALDMQLVERTKSLDDAFSERLRLFDESILRSTMAIDGAVSDKANALNIAMENHAKTLNETIGRSAIELDEALVNGINAVRRTSEQITRQSIKAIEDLGNQSELLKNVSESLLSQINNVTARFELQGQSIVHAANALESANFKIDKTLQHRQSELNQTLDRMTGKADDFGRFMQGYSTSLEGSMTEAEKRARLLTDELAKGAEARSRKTLADIERMKQSASLETERAFDDLRSKFTHVSREVSERLGTLTSQFSETSTEMRQRAARAASELEAEQARLRVQLESLPNTSRESAEAMRRALNDQLRALDELTQFAQREGNRRELSRPIDVEGTVSHPPGSVTPAPPPRRSDHTRALSTLSSSLAQEMGARQRPPAEGQGPSGAGDGRGGGWLGGVLARASRDEDGHGHHEGSASSGAMVPHAGVPDPAPTQGLNIDVIARALDQATAAAIWSRFRAGQRGIMVRSIYTPDGRIAFDDVGRRYQSDPDFQRTVQRYLADFEAMLRESERQEPSGRLAESQLVSDAGRVYLMLAHVSGRLS